MARKADIVTTVLTVLVAAGLLGLGVLVIQYAGPPPTTLPIAAGTRFRLFENSTATIDFVVGPQPGTLVGAWTADGAVCLFSPPIYANLLFTVPCPRSGSLNQSLAPGHWSMFLKPWLGSRTVMVTEAFQVVYPARSPKPAYGSIDSWSNQFPVLSRTTFGVSSRPAISVLFNLTVGPSAGTFVGAWTSTGPVCASIADWNHVLEPPLCDAFARSGTFSVTLAPLPAPAYYAVAFMQPYDAAGDVNVTVTQSFRVVYPT